MPDGPDVPEVIDREQSAGAAAAPLDLRVHEGIEEVRQPDWDGLLDAEASPFLRWAWLEALERSGAATRKTGWTPRHLGLYRGRRLVAAAPAWLCAGSDGDFSQDWGWAEAAMRAGLRYYPKLSLTVPFTPCTGRRFLVAPGEDREQAVAALCAGVRELARAERLVVSQVLFPTVEEARQAEAEGAAFRLSFQYHWHNPGYRDTDDFLSRFDSKKRNQLKRERAAPGKQGITIRTVRGDELAADPRRWARTVHTLHRASLSKMAWGRGWLNPAFYERVMTAMPDCLEVVEASREGRAIAMAFNVASATHLYGRYWGCIEEHPFLHFNVCLYHSIDQCILRGLRRFEGGAGGEHKVARGFEPSEVQSAHFFFEPGLDEAVRRHLERENRSLKTALSRWRDQTPVLKQVGAAE